METSAILTSKGISLQPKMTPSAPLDCISDSTLMNALSNNDNAKKHVVVVLRGPSASIIKPDEHLILKGFNSSIDPVNITCITHWITKKEECKTSGILPVDLSGQADNVKSALVPFVNAGLQAISIMALSCSAAIGMPEI